MKYTNLNKIRDWLKAQSIEFIDTRIEKTKFKGLSKGDYIILNNETLRFGQVENLDLMTVEIYGQKGGPDRVESIADNFIDLFSGEGKVFSDFKTIRILPTGQIPAFSIQNQYKITLFFQISYLI